MKALVAYFSASGVTKAVAERLCGAAGGTLFEIVPETLYTKEDLDWRNKQSRSSLEMNDRSCRPPVASRVENMEEYDTVFVGFPVWWYREPSVIDTFLEQYDFTGKKLVPFCTSGSSGPGESADNFRALAPGADVADGVRFPAGVTADELKEFVNSIG